MRHIKYFIIVIMLCLFASYDAFANNISVSNFSLTGQNVQSYYAMIKFDISWENSWRTSSSAPNNWDAAWIFIKYRVNGTGEWQHAWLNNTGHINPAGSTIETGLLKPDSTFNQTTNPGIGVFIYRDANGTGTFSKTGVQLRWNYGANGVPDNANIDIRVFAIEQVYVPQGSFYVGSGGTEPGGFYKYPTTTNPYQITNEGEITVGTSTDNLYYVPSGSGGSWNGDGLGPIPSSFPKGYNAFYCMKYEITQQGYVNFLNSLTQTQATVRKYSTSLYRYAITGNTVGSYSTNNPYLPCNYLLWSDFAAYLDWCGLRPMTELEFEKACRGTLAPVPNEYAWGSISVAINPYALSDIGKNDEGISTNFNTTDGNATNYSTAWLAGFQGPVRVGIFAGNSLNTGRITSGAAYYGMMEMSGNMFEYTVAAGNPTGREFTPVNGNGMLTAMGESDAATWPPVSTATGIGFRGGDWSNGAGYSKLSARSRAAYIDNSRNRSYGGRGVRLEPIQQIKQ